MDHRTAIAWVFVVIWAALYTRKIIDPSFPVPAEITPVILAVIGYLFGRDIRLRLLEKKEDDQ